jgi:hypothetical protein
MRDEGRGVLLALSAVSALAEPVEPGPTHPSSAQRLQTTPTYALLHDNLATPPCVQAATCTVIDSGRKAASSHLPNAALVGLVAVLDAVLALTGVSLAGGFNGITFESPHVFSLAVLSSSALLLYSKVRKVRGLAGWVGAPARCSGDHQMLIHLLCMLWTSGPVPDSTLHITAQPDSPLPVVHPHVPAGDCMALCK